MTDTSGSLVPAGEPATSWLALRDEAPSVTVRPAGPGQPCYSRSCARQRITAVVAVTFGRMPPLLWEDSSGKAYLMCAPCWDLTRDVAVRLVPGIEIRTAITDSPARAAGLPAGLARPPAAAHADRGGAQPQPQSRAPRSASGPQTHHHPVPEEPPQPRRSTP